MPPSWDPESVTAVLGKRELTYKAVYSAHFLKLVEYRCGCGNQDSKGCRKFCVLRYFSYTYLWSRTFRLIPHHQACTFNTDAQFNSTGRRRLASPPVLEMAKYPKHRMLNRTSSHRQALLRNLVTSLFLHESISTTWPKAKEAQRLAEKCVTLAKKGTNAARLRAQSIFYVCASVLSPSFSPTKTDIFLRP